MGGLLSINPVWKYGPYDPSKVTAGSQPDWYMGWPDGALRIMPGLGDAHLGLHDLVERACCRSSCCPMLMFTILLLLPFLEAWITGDKREHHLLQRPRNAPTRTALMVALMTFYGLFWAAGGNDIIAIKLHLSHQPDHLLHAGRGLRRPGDRVHHHPALVHLAAAQGQRDAAARLRDRHHHALARGRLHRAAPADHRRRAPTRSPRATATEVDGRPTAGRRQRRRRAAASGRLAGVRARLSQLCSPTTSRSRPREELEEGHHHAEHEHELQAPIEGHPADGHQFDGHHPVEGENAPRRRLTHAARTRGPPAAPGGPRCVRGSGAAAGRGRRRRGGAYGRPARRRPRRRRSAEPPRAPHQCAALPTAVAQRRRSWRRSPIAPSVQRGAAGPPRRGPALARSRRAARPRLPQAAPLARDARAAATRLS